VSGQDLSAAKHPTDTLAPSADRALGFSVTSRNARGQIVRLDTSLNAILSAHDYPPVLATLLAEALLLTALLGATLRPDAKSGTTGDAGQMTLQAQSTGGAVDLLVCDYHAGALRGYLRFDAERFAALEASGAALDLPALFGEGHLAITLDPTAAAERYQGIVALEGASLTDAATNYFAQSEQLPTLIRLGISAPDAASGRGWIAGGLLVQHLARAESGAERLDVAPLHPDWQHVAILAGTATEAELTDTTLPEESLLWRLFNEDETRVTPAPTPVRGCRCSIAHITDVLRRFPEAERVQMRGPDGHIGVDCAFCAKTFAVVA
jgi:molecular chaperone Hsp33